MEKEIVQRKVFGLDVHPSCFTAASFYENERNARQASPIKVQDKIPMELFDSWLQKHTEKGDILILEALSISFDLVRRIETQGRTGIVLDSRCVGKLGNSYLKNDKVDAVKIAKVYFGGFDDRVWIPDSRTQERRDILFAYRNAVKDTTRHSCRIWAYLTQNGVVVNKSIRKTCKDNFNRLLALKDWSHSQKIILKTYFSDYQAAYNKRKLLEKVMAEEALNDPDMIKLQQFYGIRHISSYALMAIIGNINRFQNPKKLVAYLGLNPNVKDSGKETKTGKMTKNGRGYTKSILMECAKSIIQYAPADHALAKWARRLKYRKSSNVVTGAVARKLVTAIWYVLKGYSSPLTELNKMITTKLSKVAVIIGKERRAELGYKTLKEFVQIKGEFLLNST